MASSGCRHSPRQPATAAATAPRIVGGAPGVVPEAGITSGPLLHWQPVPEAFRVAGSRTDRIALTFDAGSDARAVPLILKTLHEHHARATFFLTGRFAEKFPAECRAIAGAGMELGNHSYSHPHFTRLSETAIRRELAQAETAIQKACGRTAKPLFRFPYGDMDARTARAVAAAGYQPIAWTLDSLDSVGKPKSSDYVAGRIIRKVRPGYVTLMHVSCVDSARALPRIFDHLDHVRATAVPVSALLLNWKTARQAPPVRSGKRGRRT